MAALPDVTGASIPYREEIRHPALNVAEIASGALSLEGEDLVREQRLPESERAVIGADVLSVTKAKSTSPNILPIPEEMRPLLSTLRALIMRDAAGLTDRTDLSHSAAGWDLSFPDLDAGMGSLRVTGCGGRLRQIEMVDAAGTQRTLILGLPE